jgi:hypothetical protein
LKALPTGVMTMRGCVHSAVFLEQTSQTAQPL